MSVAAPLRVLAAVRGGAHLVTRPRGVVHVAVGGVTRSGRYLRRDAGPFCRARTGRLHVFGSDVSTVPASDRRFCRRCVAALPVSLGSRVKQLVTRDDDLAAYGHFTLDDFLLSAAWLGRTRHQLAGLDEDAVRAEYRAAMQETHQVSRIASVVLGHRAAEPVSEACIAKRKGFERLARTPDEIAAMEAIRAADAATSERLQRQRQIDAVRDRNLDRANRGIPIFAHECELPHSA